MKTLELLKIREYKKLRNRYASILDFSESTKKKYLKIFQEQFQEKIKEAQANGYKEGLALAFEKFSFQLNQLEDEYKKLAHDLRKQSKDIIEGIVQTLFVDYQDEITKSLTEKINSELQGSFANSKLNLTIQYDHSQSMINDITMNDIIKVITNHMEEHKKNYSKERRETLSFSNNEIKISISLRDLQTQINQIIDENYI